MPTNLNPKEIYLLERYISPDYFQELRDTWTALVEHVESCLASFMRNLPANYRARPLPDQPDIVWGDRVLPNFRNTLQGLNTGCALLSHGDPKGLHYAYGPRGDYKGQLDYSVDWMEKKDEDAYQALLNKAVAMAHNITMTEGAYWRHVPLSRYSDDPGPLNPPAQWPSYRVNRNASVRTGEKTRQSGIYVPDVDASPQFLSANYEQAPPASVPAGYEDDFHPITGEKSGQHPIYDEQSCVWYLVERISGEATPPPPPAYTSQLHRLAAGDRCPETGYYFTPARSDSRRLFQKGDVMPGFDSTYGETIWQWDSNQQ